uniref:Histone H2A n=1 Tax=Acrobeloides nanus TaxID=290746 RepID=A0A914EKF7_9BILA
MSEKSATKTIAKKTKKAAPQISAETRQKAIENRKKAITKSARAGLVFPVTRIHRFLKDGSSEKRVTQTAAVYLTAIDLNAKRISPRHLMLAIKGDEELDLLVSGTISGGGVIPHIHRVLLEPSKQAAASQGYTPAQAAKKP